MTGSDENSSANVTDSQVERLLGLSGLNVFPADVQEKVESILASGQSLEPQTRLTFVDAARRGTTYFARMRSPLEVILFNRRQESGLSTEQLGIQSKLDASSIFAIERGDRSIDSESAENVATWSVVLSITREQLAAGLRRSLASPSSVGAYGDAQSFELNPQQDSYVAAVLKAFDEQSQDLNC
jgi:transcriptional regulator with XRE-family HTH domain